MRVLSKATGRGRSRGKDGILKSILVFLILFASSAYSFAETPQAPEVKTVETSGMAVVTAGNTAMARDAALGDALRKAVEQSVGTMVSSDTMVANYQVLSDNVYTNTQGYIKSYDIINEGQDSGVYQIRVRASVAIGSLKNDLTALGILQQKAQRPRVLFLIAEKNIGQKYYHFWWWGKSEYMGEVIDMSSAETALKEAFVKNGFTVVDTGAREGFPVEEAYRIADLTSVEARALGKDLNAELVVYGKAMAKEGPGTEGSAVATYIADITAQAVRVDDGVVLAVSGGHGTSRNISDVTGGSEALSRASTDLAGRLMEQITARWSSGVNIITITLSGVNEYKKLVEFKNALKGRVRGIEAVYQRKFEENEAVFEVESKVPAQSVADDISKIAAYLKVVKTTPNTIYVIADADKRQ